MLKDAFKMTCYLFGVTALFIIVLFAIVLGISLFLNLFLSMKISLILGIVLGLFVLMFGLIFIDQKYEDKWGYINVKRTIRY